MNSITSGYKKMFPVNFGRLSEWFMEAVLKTVDPATKGSGGSNPSPSAKKIRKYGKTDHQKSL